ncbi:MAG: hypothetical protein KAG26_05860 [Methylococcales bacterium]|nr:hypothetical protein [Methylococcales bacterium]
MSDKKLPVSDRFDEKSYYVLKNLLLAKERQRLETLEFYFQNPKVHAEKIALALPYAIKKTDPVLLREALDDALQETVKNCLIESIHREPAVYVEALYPVIFPMIKKSIAEAFKEVMQSLNSAIEEGLSINRLGWHYQAWRAGIPYREIVLRNTLAYRVEQAFLIDRNTGLLLRHVSIEGVDELRDSDAVSAMLMAIQDFTQDSFSSNENDQLNTVEVGEYTVFLNRGAYAMLACVIQGIPPYQLRAKFDSILGDIHQHHIDLLKHFEGDSAPLAVIDETLDQCLLSEHKNEDQKKSGVSGKYILIPLLLILVLFSYWAYDHWKFEQRRNNYLTLLQQYEGVVVTNNHTDHDKLMIKGLYDPLIVNPHDVLQNSDLQTNEVVIDWQPYHSLVPAIVIQRLRNVLQIPPYVTVTLKGTVLKLSGVADVKWIENLKAIKPVLTGVTHIEITSLKNYTHVIKTELNVPNTVHFNFDEGTLQLQGTAAIAWYHQATQKIAALKFIHQVEWHQLTIAEAKKLQLLKEQLEKQTIYFTGDTINANDANVLQGVLDLLKKMADLNQLLAQKMRLTVTGYTDGLDSIKYNKILAQTRAKTVIDFLKPHLLSVEMQMASQLSHTQRSNKLQRKVGFSVSFNKE